MVVMLSPTHLYRSGQKGDGPIGAQRRPYGTFGPPCTSLRAIIYSIQTGPRQGAPNREPFMQVIYPPGKGRRPAPIFYNVTRHLNEADISALWDPQRENTGPRIKALRYNHHLLAKAVASGKSGLECANLTGLTPTRVSDLKNDPAFQELVSYYADEMNEVYVDVHQRMAALGTSILEELAERFEADPDKFTKRELLEMFTTMADRSIPTAKGGPAPQQAIVAGANGGLALQINFVSPQGDSPKTIDIPAQTQAPAVRTGEDKPLSISHSLPDLPPPLPLDLPLDGEPETPAPALYPTRPEILQAKRDLVLKEIEQREADAAERERVHEEYLRKKREQLYGEDTSVAES